MRNSLRHATLAAVLILTAGCSDLPSPSAPTPPRPAGPVQPIPEPLPAPPFPAVSRSARLYVAAESRYYSGHGSLLASRYVLYDDNTFSLQYASINYPFFEYRGDYSEANGQITFGWPTSRGAQWQATGVITEDSLTVEYNLDMQMSDFEDGVYIRAK
jgi:hypothetical protein